MNLETYLHMTSSLKYRVVIEQKHNRSHSWTAAESVSVGESKGIWDLLVNGVTLRENTE